MILIWVRFCRTLMKKKSDIHKCNTLILYVLIVCTWNQKYQWGKNIFQVLKQFQKIVQIAIWKSRCFNRERHILSCHKCGNQTSDLEINAKLWSFPISLQVQNIPSFLFYLQMLKVSQEKSPHPQKKIKLFLKLKAKFKVIVMHIPNSNT